MQEGPLELQDLLGNLHKEGQVESTGAFTLDIRHAMEKLAKFQLEKPSDYVLKLVQSAVAAGASAIHLNSNPLRVSLQMEGVCYTELEVELLLQNLLDGYRERRQRHLRHLAVAVNSAIGIKASEISLDCWNGHSGFRHVWGKNGPTQRPSRGSGPPSTMFTLVRSFKDKKKSFWDVLNNDCLDLLFKRRAAMDDEQGAVNDNCVFSHVPITINGAAMQTQVFGAPRFPGCRNAPGPYDVANTWRATFDGKDYQCGMNKKHHLIESYYPAQEGQPEPTLITPPSSSATLAPHCVPGEPYAMAAAIPVHMTNSLRIHFVEDGVRLQLKKFYVDYQNEFRPLASLGKAPDDHKGLARGGIVILCASRFSKDLSQFHVTENEEYQQALAEVKTRLQELRVGMVRNQDRYPSSLLPTLRRQVPEATMAQPG